MNDRTFVYVIHIATTPEKLWEALTSGEFTEQFWGGRRIESDWQVGSPVKHCKPDGQVEWEGRILESNPPKKLSYTFQGKGEHWDDTTSRVVWEIEPSGPDTAMLRLVHDQLTEKNLKGISMGWPAILSNLKSLLERGETLNFYWKG